MAKAQASSKNKILVQLLKWKGTAPVTQEEAEARLHQEGYHTFCWYDVPETCYPPHKHKYDECIWVLRGEIQFTIKNKIYLLRSGDKLYLSAQTVHEIQVPKDKGVTYLVGQKT
jgi:mannose-6-phosphate isomerase-like protein (cupin superfamily)